VNRIDLAFLASLEDRRLTKYIFSSFAGSRCSPEENSLSWLPTVKANCIDFTKLAPLNMDDVQAWR
jgi:hypothetical protein